MEAADVEEIAEGEEEVGGSSEREKTLVVGRMERCDEEV